MTVALYVFEVVLLLAFSLAVLARGEGEESMAADPRGDRTAAET